MTSYAPTVALQRGGKPHEQLTLTIRNDLAELTRVFAIADELLQRRAVAPHVIYATHLALEEILSNVIRHGHGDGKRHDIELLLRVDEGSVEIQVVDDGQAFNPLTATEARVDVPLAQRKAGGLGIRLLRGFVNEMRYERLGERNLLWMRI